MKTDVKLCENGLEYHRATKGYVISYRYIRYTLTPSNLLTNFRYIYSKNHREPLPSGDGDLDLNNFSINNHAIHLNLCNYYPYNVIRFTFMVTRKAQYINTRSVFINHVTFDHYT